MEAIIGSIIVAVITSGGTLLGVIFSNSSANKKVVNDIKMENVKSTNEIKLELTKYKASTDEKIIELTREVREHNNFAKRMPVVENEIKHIEERMTELHKGD